MEPPTLSTGSHSVASPSVLSIRNVPSWVSSTTRSWTTWYVVLLCHPTHGDVSAVYSNRKPRILSHPRLWPTNEATIGRSETPHFPVQGTLLVRSSSLSFACRIDYPDDCRRGTGLWPDYTRDRAEMRSISTLGIRSCNCGAWMDGAFASDDGKRCAQLLLGGPGAIDIPWWVLHIKIHSPLADSCAWTREIGCW